MRKFISLEFTVAEVNEILEALSFYDSHNEIPNEILSDEIKEQMGYTEDK